MKRAAQLRELGLTAAGIKVGLHINYASRTTLSRSFYLALGCRTLPRPGRKFRTKIPCIMGPFAAGRNEK